MIADNCTAKDLKAFITRVAIRTSDNNRNPFKKSCLEYRAAGSIGRECGEQLKGAVSGNSGRNRSFSINVAAYYLVFLIYEHETYPCCTLFPIENLE
jgi:hypothetical protein